MLSELGREGMITLKAVLTQVQNDMMAQLPIIQELGCPYHLILAEKELGTVTETIYRLNINLGIPESDGIEWGPYRERRSVVKE